MYIYNVYYVKFISTCMCVCVCIYPQNIIMFNRYAQVDDIFCRTKLSSFITYAIAERPSSYIQNINCATEFIFSHKPA